MAERNPPVWIQDGTYAALDDRMVTGLLIDRTTGPTGNLVALEGGVVPPFDQMQLSAPGGMTYSISAGLAIIPAKNPAPPGAYVCYNDGVFTGTIAPELSSNPRIDLIVARVSDPTADAAGAWHFTTIKGIAGVNPVSPQNTTDSIMIASVRVMPKALNGGVDKIAAGQITDLRNFITSIGGTHVHWGSSPLPAHSPGRIVYDATAGSLLVNNGTAYEPVYTLQEWLDYFKMYRPVSASDNTRTSKTVRNEWDATPALTADATKRLSPVQRTDVHTPSGMIRVSMIVLGRVETAGLRGSVSVRVLHGGTTEFSPNATRGVAFYSTTWGQSSSTFVITGLPLNDALTVRLEFYKDDPDQTGDAAIFTNMYLLVEPVI